MFLDHVPAVQALVFFVNPTLPFGPVAINEEAPKLLELPTGYPVVALVDVKGLLHEPIGLQYGQDSPRLSNLLQTSSTVTLVVIPEYPAREQTKMASSVYPKPYKYWQKTYIPTLREPSYN